MGVQRTTAITLSPNMTGARANTMIVHTKGLTTDCITPATKAVVR